MDYLSPPSESTPKSPIVYQPPKSPLCINPLNPPSGGLLKPFILFKPPIWGVGGLTFHLGGWGVDFNSGEGFRERLFIPQSFDWIPRTPPSSSASLRSSQQFQGQSIHQWQISTSLISVLNAKFSSHLFIAYQAIGQATINAIITHFIIFLLSIPIISNVVAPLAFLIPISLVRRSIVNTERPKSPILAINRASKANEKRRLSNFLSDLILQIIGYIQEFIFERECRAYLFPCHPDLIKRSGYIAAYHFNIYIVFIFPCIEKK